MEKVSWSRRLQYTWEYYTRLSLREKAFISLFNHILFKENQYKEYIVRGAFMSSYDKARAKAESQCSHRKGGRVNLEVGVFENGTDDQYAVCKHKLPFGDYIVKCLRCGKKWSKPDKKDFKSDLDFQVAYLQYKEAINFPTRNTTSTSMQFQKFEKKSFMYTLSIIWSILKRDISVVSSLRDGETSIRRLT